jgi:hypothetical protein
MQNQVPLWVTLTLAVIAIMGPIGGALIGGKVTARRDDSRWERELEREELRRTREIELEENRWAREIERENRRYWLDLRTSSYSDTIEAWRRFLDIGEKIKGSVAIANATGEEYIISDEATKFNAASGELESALLRSEICSSNAIQIQSVEAMRHVSKYTSLVYKAIFFLNKKGDAWSDVKEVDNQLRVLQTMSRKFTEAVKKEIAVLGGSAE